MSKNLRNGFFLILCVVAVSVGAIVPHFTSNENLTGQASGVTSWKVAFTNIAVCTDEDEYNNAKCMAPTGNATNVSDKTVIDTTDNLKATFTTNVINPGDSITYKVDVTNNGTIDAKVASIGFEKVADETLPVIFTYKNIDVDSVIKVGETRTIYVMVSYLDDGVISTNEYSNTLDLVFNVDE